MMQTHFSLENRKLGIATKHGKEKVITPAFSSVKMLTIMHIPADTDQLGTFSGEIPRHQTAVEAVRTKCEWVFRDSDADLAIATEGSFGNHPFLPGVPFHSELMMAKDRISGVEWIEQVHTVETNYREGFAATPDELARFCTQIGFPQNGVLLSATPEGPVFYKELTQAGELHTVFQELLHEHKSVYVQTDMRAHRNSLRMNKIKELAECMCTRLQTPCPGCHQGGFGMTEVIRGARCESCLRPSESPLAELFHCHFCGHSEPQNYSKFQNPIDAQYCAYCNP
jgi:hypothetical protein